jgi:amidase
MGDGRGLPAVRLPVHWNGGTPRAGGTTAPAGGGPGLRGPGNGLPMGIQLIGPMGSEALLLQVAAQLGF